MKELINATSKELWIAINQLDKTFEWRLNWFYHRKVEDLWKILDNLIELQEKEKLLNNK